MSKRGWVVTIVVLALFVEALMFSGVVSNPPMMSRTVQTGYKTTSSTIFGGPGPIYGTERVVDKDLLDAKTQYWTVVMLATVGMGALVYTLTPGAKGDSKDE